MGLTLPYMGTKRRLAPVVKELVSAARDGPMLDAFSGMCAVGEAVADLRQVWNNDVQHFAALVAKALFTCRDLPRPFMETADLHYGYFEKNYNALARRFGSQLGREHSLLENGNWRDLQGHQFSQSGFHLRPKITAERSSLRRHPASFPYCLFTTTYANTYFGWSQSAEIDSIKYAIDVCHLDRHSTSDQRDWLLVALGQAMLRVSSTTGHFAQYLMPKRSTSDRYRRQRKRSVWQEWIRLIPELAPLRSAAWRRRNRAYREDSLTLLKWMKGAKLRPSVVYADPPYTDDQYSRYYHLLETLVLYDYPDVTGHARYRTHRYHTPFSTKANVAEAFELLIGAAASLKAEFILSYPTNGLLHEVGVAPLQLLKRAYRKVEICHRGAYHHSTFGASKGPATAAVIEVIYRAQP
jgi:adenine-specific DNA-methyltransferase